MPFVWLIDLVEGRLSADDQELAQAHIAVCICCAAKATWVKRVVELMRADCAVDAPPQVIERVIRLFNLRTPSASI